MLALCRDSFLRNVALHSLTLAATQSGNPFRSRALAGARSQFRNDLTGAEYQPQSSAGQPALQLFSFPPTA